MTALAATTTSSENYLIAICTLTDEGEQPTLARLAAHCGVTLPTVGEAARKLARDGLVWLAPRRNVELTAAGRELAESLQRRHRLIERWLTDVLGLDWATVHEEAHRLEHAVSPTVEERLAASIGFPATCPHGNPIIPPTLDERLRLRVTLDAIDAGSEVRLLRISEIAEDLHELMRFFERNGFRPGTRLTVLDRGPLNGPISVAVDGTRVPISLEAASFLVVQSAIGSTEAAAGA